LNAKVNFFVNLASLFSNFADMKPNPLQTSNSEDTFRTKGLRKRLVELLQSKGIKNQSVLNAIEKIPRHLFLDPAFLEFAYQDKPFPIGSGQTISQPFTVAFQSCLLDVKQR